MYGFRILLLFNVFTTSLCCHEFTPDVLGCERPNIFDDLLKLRTALSFVFSYQIVIDGGSTGTRIHVFKFRQKQTGFFLEDTFYREIEPGLSYYLEEPTKGAYSVCSLIKEASSFVPKSQWSTTPISLRATAGLRLLPKMISDEIVNTVGFALVSSPFKTIQSEFISIMDGDDEGILAWISLNFLTDNLDRRSQNTTGTLDLGGGSTQIVFKPMSKLTISKSPESHISNVKILGNNHDLYSFSYLGLGLMSARQAVFELTKVHSILNESSNQIITSSPCMAPSYQQTWSFSAKEILVRGNQSFSYENCLHYMKEIVTEVHKPAELVNTTFYAFSYYYETAVELDLVERNVGASISLETYTKAAERVCSNKHDERLSESPFLCLDSVYITTLLRNGFGFLESQLFQVANNVNNVELSWALGAALQMLQ